LNLVDGGGGWNDRSCRADTESDSACGGLLAACRWTIGCESEEERSVSLRWVGLLEGNGGGRTYAGAMREARIVMEAMNEYCILKIGLLGVWRSV